jgi:RNA polymerase sigma-70 factor (ECF subfamily)
MSRPSRRVDRTNEAWVAAVRARDEAALADLRAALVVALRPTLARLAPAQADALGEDLAQDALLRILDAVDTFRGEAQFTTWAATVATRLAFSELRRHRWRDVSLDAMVTDVPAADGDLAADDAMARDERAAIVRRVLAEDLTERQREALTAVLVHGVPLDVLAERMDTNRNALYKLLHDARQRLKRALVARGFTPDDLHPG